MNRRRAAAPAIISHGRRALVLMPCALLWLPVWAETAAKTIVRASPLDSPERKVAVQYLEAIQRSAYRALGTQPRTFDDEFLKDMRQRVLESSLGKSMPAKQREQYFDELLAKIRSSSHSKYEDPLGFLLISDLDTKLRKVIARSSVKLPAQPVYGTLPTRNVNARTFAVPGVNTQIVAFEDQIWNFANLFTKAIAMGVPSIGEKDGQARFSTNLAHLGPWLQSHPEAAQRLEEVLKAYIVDGVPGTAPQYFLGEPHGLFAGILRDAMELFVLAHEYGHVIGNHVGADQAVLAAIADSEYQEIIRSWTHEVEADGIGLQLTVAAGRAEGLDVAMSYAGADLFFTSLDIVGRSLRAVRDGVDRPTQPMDDATTSHPSPLLRRARLRKGAVAYFGDAGKSAVAMSEFIQQVVEELWKTVGPRLIELHRAGARPHRRWLVAAGAPATPLSSASAPG